MKLYCIKILNNNDEIVDAQHMLGNECKEIYNRMDGFLEGCKRCNLQDKYNSYKFNEVNLVDGISLDKIFENYEIINNKVKHKEETIHEYMDGNGIDTKGIFGY